MPSPEFFLRCQLQKNPEEKSSSLRRSRKSCRSLEPTFSETEKTSRQKSPPISESEKLAAKLRRVFPKQKKSAEKIWRFFRSGKSYREKSPTFSVSAKTDFFSIPIASGYLKPLHFYPSVHQNQWTYRKIFTIPGRKTTPVFHTGH